MRIVKRKKGNSWTREFVEDELLKDVKKDKKIVSKSKSKILEGEAI